MAQSPPPWQARLAVAPGLGPLALAAGDSIDVTLPQPTLNPPPVRAEPPPPIRLRIDAGGQVFWNDSPQPLSVLPTLMREAVQADPTNQPTLEIDTNADADYGTLAKVLAHAKNAQMEKIGFVQN